MVSRFTPAAAGILAIALLGLACGVQASQLSGFESPATIGSVHGSTAEASPPINATASAGPHSSTAPDAGPASSSADQEPYASREAALEEAREFGMIGVFDPDGGTSKVVANPGVVVNARLPPELIQSIVRAEYDRLRACYDQGLKTNPRLAGHFATRFVIGRDGSVAQVADAGSTLPDEVAKRCMFDVFSSLKFPAPEGGIVTVVYPIMFSPGDPQP